MQNTHLTPNVSVPQAGFSLSRPSPTTTDLGNVDMPERAWSAVVAPLPVCSTQRLRLPVSHPHGVRGPRRRLKRTPHGRPSRFPQRLPLRDTLSLPTPPPLTPRAAARLNVHATVGRRRACLDVLQTPRFLLDATPWPRSYLAAGFGPVASAAVMQSSVLYLHAELLRTAGRAACSTSRISSST